jgi:hypothetical protein
MRKTLITAVAGLAVTACLTATANVSNPDYNTLDVSTPGSSGSINGAIFSYDDRHPTGTGFIDPFLREQAKASDNGVELGVNTSIKAQTIDAAPQTTLFDNKNPVNYTHDLAISTLTTVTDGGKTYYQFFLDANQVGNGPISLTTLKVFVVGTAATTPAALGTILAGTPVYDMNNPAASNKKPNQVIVSSQHGSGSGDMFVLIPATGITGNNFLYLEAGFGEGTSNFGANDGFEEWNAKTGVPPPPGAPDSASALGLLGIAITGIEVLRRKIRA